MNLDFSKLNELINDTYYPYLWCESRFFIVYGGSGGGKSYFIAQRIMYKLLTEPGHNWLVVREVAATNRQSTYALIVQVANEWGVGACIKRNNTDLTIVCKHNGNSIVFAGLDDVEKLKSITFQNGVLTDIWIEEASETREEDFTQLNLRLRGQAQVPFQIVLSFNPVSCLHWLKARFFDNPDRNCTILKTTYRDNRFIDDTYKSELENLIKHDPIAHAVYALGEWGEAGDVVFRNVVYEPSTYQYEDYDDVYVGMDFGFNHYHAIIWIGIKDDELYAFRELYVRQLKNEDIIYKARNLLDKEQVVYADSAEPKSIADWKGAGYNVWPVKKGPDSVRAQLSYLMGRRFHIDPQACPGLKAEVQGFVMRKDKNGQLMEIDNAIGIHDDAIAAARYAISTLCGRRKLDLIL